MKRDRCRHELKASGTIPPRHGTDLAGGQGISDRIVFAEWAGKLLPATRRRNPGRRRLRRLTRSIIVVVIA